MEQKRQPLKTMMKGKASMFREVYPILEPYVFAAVVRDPLTQKIRYELIEPTLLQDEEEALAEIKSILMEEVDASLKDFETREKAEEYLQNKVKGIIENYHVNVTKEAVNKLLYYIRRDFIGYGKITPLMEDHLIEDISADGVNVPIYIWHREYESLPTNIVFKTSKELNSFIIRLAYLAGRQISLAKPMLDATLPDGSRIQLTYGSEITRRGSTFTIRRFRVDPLTVSDLIAFNTLSSEMAAYFWYIIENRASVLVAGGVAAGKTTTLNCLSMFIKPELKIVSVEDTAEINLPHENWIPSVVRMGAEEKGAGTITLFDLLKTAVRQRPDFIIVGEVRGKEAYTLFQAMATGHLGLGTIHAESAGAVLQRLESEPMNIPRQMLTMIDNILVQSRVEVKGKPARRIRTVTEVIGLNPKTKDVKVQEVFTWNARDDSFSFSEKSSLLKKIMERKGLDERDVHKELRQRKTVLEWMTKNNIRRYIEVADVIREYCADPARMFRKARMQTQ